MKINKKQGTGLLEVVVGLTIVSVSLFSLMSVLNISFGLMEQATKKNQASFLLEEGIEALRILRDSSWQENIDSLGVGIYYYFNFSENEWQAVSTNLYIDGIFERNFVLSDVYRDSNDDIVESGGVLDPSTKKAVVSVSWLNKKGTTTESISTYVTNIFND